MDNATTESQTRPRREVVTLALSAQELAFVMACVLEGAAIMDGNVDRQSKAIRQILLSGDMLGSDAERALVDRINAGAVAIVTSARTTV